MNAIYFLSVLAVASASPLAGHYGNPHYSRHFAPQSDLADSDLFRSYIRDDDLFDTMKMWKELSDKLVKLDDALSELYKHFPSGMSQEGTEGGKYIIRIPLSGFTEKDIVVKARTGLLMVQATHKYDDSNMMNSYLNLRNIPTNIAETTGSWKFENDILTIKFQLKDSEVTTETVQVTTNDPQSREEMEPHGNDGSSSNGDADVGLESDNKTETPINKESWKNNDVEATTYAVDVSNDIEFVPIKYK